MMAMINLCPCGLTYEAAFDDCKRNTWICPAYHVDQSVDENGEKKKCGQHISLHPREQQIQYQLLEQQRQRQRQREQEEEERGKTCSKFNPDFFKNENENDNDNVNKKKKKKKQNHQVIDIFQFNVQ